MTSTVAQALVIKPVMADVKAVIRIATADAAKAVQEVAAVFAH